MINITVKQILEEKYIYLKNKYWYNVPKYMHIQIDETVNNAMKCSDVKYGFAEYICEDCGGSTKIPFTFNSKFCNKCGRLYASI